MGTDTNVDATPSFLLLSVVHRDVDYTVHVSVQERIRGTSFQSPSPLRTMADDELQLIR